MTIKRIFSIFFAMLFVTVAAVAQKPADDPVKWRMTVKMTSPDEGSVTLRAIVSDGWHLYGTELPANGPVPTTFNFDASTGVRFVGDFVPSVAPVTRQDANFGMKLAFWETNVTFTRKFKLTGDVKNAIINGWVRFMGCNDVNCLPPATKNFKTAVKPFTPAK